jgi:hypothetical protein
MDGHLTGHHISGLNRAGPRQAFRDTLVRGGWLPEQGASEVAALLAGHFAAAPLAPW